MRYVNEPWSIAALADLVSIKTGKLNSNAAVENGAYPFFTCSRETYKVDTYSFDCEAVLLAGNNANGVYPVKYYKGKFDAYQRTYIIRPADNCALNIRYLFYALQLELDLLQSLSTGSATKFLTLTILNALKVRLPSLIDQNRIVSILGAYDDLIENNTRRIEIIEEMARRLYEEWFVQFRFPGREGVEFGEGEFGLAPKGWSPATVKNLVIRLKGGKAYKSAELQGDGSIIVVDQSRAEYLGFHDNEPCYLASPKTPAIIFGDHTCKMQVMVMPFSVGPNTVVFAGQKGHSPYYIYSLVRGLVSTAEYKRHWSDLTGKIVLEAPATLSTRYGEMVSPMFAEIELLRRKNRNLRAQRDLLLPKLISGEIDVSDIPMPT
ncbi:restriction endonuclease subunit S [Pseudomonas putida]|uniref:restriction endonuclease subunit S n=1 Tax=Pseudomonas putida TaxID=303 RepID=UPI000CD42896|nr:restriction endonuclease subunit S [Pseudomonas putida]